jgi:O-antigen/teichoic acid export membrane protein
MHALSSQPGRHVLDGTIRVFLAEALLLPTGLLTTAFLTRRLGPEGYGLSLVGLLFLLLGEFSAGEIAMVRSMFPWRTTSKQDPGEV